MLLRIWRLFSILLTALAFATAFAHLLVLAPELRYEAGLHANLRRTLYANYARGRWPANQVMAALPPDAVPVDWTLWRDRWEFSHAVRALAMHGGLIVLIVSVLQETRGEMALARLVVRWRSRLSYRAGPSEGVDAGLRVAGLDDLRRRPCPGST